MTRVFYDSESDKILTLDEVKACYEAFCDDKKEETFCDFLRNACDKNGSLTELDISEHAISRAVNNLSFFTGINKGFCEIIERMLLDLRYNYHSQREAVYSGISAILDYCDDSRIANALDDITLIIRAYDKIAD